ncbi:hypothetical protein GCM10020000_33970 [Streptomyces olivoverticillatus]
MSVQAVDLGHGPEALRLADAAAAASPQAGPRMRAFLAGQQAHSAAQTGDRNVALLYLKEAEAAMEKAESREKAFGSYDPSSLHYHISQVRHELGDLPGAVEAMKESDRLCYDVYRRTRVKERAMLGEFQMQVGHLEAACATWNEALDEYPLVQSGRVDQRVQTMFGLLRPHLKKTPPPAPSTSAPASSPQPRSWRSRRPRGAESRPAGPLGGGDPGPQPVASSRNER